MADPKSDANKAFETWLGNTAKKLGVGEACKTDDKVQNSVTEKDWTTTLRGDFIAAVQRWALGMQVVVVNFQSDMRTAQTKPDDVTLAVTIVKGVVSEFLPRQAKVAVAVAGPIMARVVKELQGSKVSLADFCRKWDKAFNDFKSAQGEHKKMFEAFRTHAAAKCGSDLSVQAVTKEIAYLSQQLPKPDAIRKALLKAWIDSSEDECWLWDMDKEAGYFKVNIMRRAQDKWEITKAYLDDTDQQAGVIAMLQREYPNQKLEALPFPMKVFIMHGITNNNFTKYEKGRSGGWKKVHGMPEVWDAWRKSGQAVATTKHLTKE